MSQYVLKNACVQQTLGVGTDGTPTPHYCLRCQQWYPYVHVTFWDPNMLLVAQQSQRSCHIVMIPLTPVKTTHIKQL